MKAKSKSSHHEKRMHHHMKKAADHHNKAADHHEKAHAAMKMMKSKKAHKKEK